MFEKLAYRLILWRQKRIAVHKLNRLDDHLLQDLGTSRDCVEDFVRDHVSEPRAKQRAALKDGPWTGKSVSDAVDADRGRAAIAETELVGRSF